MIYLKLFLSFLMIGTVSFGGGYGMISLIRETVLKNGWLGEGEFMNFIAVSESTPGPLAINIATFVGSSQGGFFGAVCATLGVVLPSFIIILIIAAIIKNLLNYGGVNAFLSGVRPCIVAMILATAVIMAFDTLFSFKAVGSGFSPNIKSILLFVFLILLSSVYRRIRKKNISPIFMIILSAGCGIILFGAQPLY